jgi:hypothetical protein
MKEDELENPETWDYDSAVLQKSGRNQKTVVAVTFTRQEFEALTRSAEDKGVTVPEFLRTAGLKAIEAAKTRP